MAKRKTVDQSQIKLRIREDLRVKLEQSAEKNDESLNREIVNRLEESFERPSAMLDMLAARYGQQVAGLLVVLGEVVSTTAASSTAQIIWGSGDTGEIQMAMYAGARNPQLSHPYVFAQAAGAVSMTLDALKPPAADSPPDSDGRDFERLTPRILESFKSPLKMDAVLFNRVLEMLGELKLKDPQ